MARTPKVAAVAPEVETASTKPTDIPFDGGQPAKKAKSGAFKMPKTLAGVADLLYETRDARLALSKKVSELEDQESAMKAHLIDNLPKGNATGVSGRMATARIVIDQEPRVADWPTLYAHVKKTGQFELLGRALGKAAIKERWEARKEVPGVEHFTVVKVSLTKVK